ncbi:MAG: hypothetical protein AAGJ79_14705 [Verrucomicrobiota bacterium]
MKLVFLVSFFLSAVAATGNSPVVSQSPIPYRWVSGWGVNADGGTLPKMHGDVVADKAGNVYASVDGMNSILVFGPEGEVKRAFGKHHQGIHGMILREENGKEFIYAAGGTKVSKFDLEGNVEWTIEGPPKVDGLYPKGAKFRLTGVEVGPDGRIYVADGYGSKLIHIYSADQKYLKTFGGQGSMAGKFATAHGITLDPRGEFVTLLVADRDNRRIQRFDLDGIFIEVVAKNLRRPCDVSVFGPYLALPEIEGRVTLLDPSGNVAARIGHNPDESQWANPRVPVADWKDGLYLTPHGSGFDAEGNLYIVAWNQTGRISKLEWVK